MRKSYSESIGPENRASDKKRTLVHSQLKVNQNSLFSPTLKACCEYAVKTSPMVQNTGSDIF